MSLSLKRRYPFCMPQSSPTTAAPNAPLPAFVSIFDRDVEMSGYPAVNGSSQTLQGPSKAAAARSGISGMRTASPEALALLPQPQSSVSTSASSSSNSSPTTTISTVASANTDEHHHHHTPDSSPDSPSPTMPLPPFKHSSRFADRDLDVVPPSPGLGGSRPLSPSKRPRNTKNLSLNMSPPPDSSTPSELLHPGEPTHSNGPTPRSMSAPSSPAFIMPPPPPQNPRRRPSALGLTIKLPGTLPEKTAVRGGSGVGGLRHHQSSPSLFSPALRGPPGGMTLPQSASVRQTTFQIQRPAFNTRWASDSLSSSMSSSSISNSPPRTPEPSLPEMVEEEDEVEPRSGEAKSPAYPEGPVCIFEPNIYLYAEPDAELASQFDVVINVAREVHNPFKPKPQVPETKIIPETPVPDTAATDISFRTAYEDAVFSPVEAPKQYKEPEYIHMPWDHNTPILDDLPKLVELISERANEGKKILVHCQCGVSRSATLLIAYSMFKNPEKGMQDAYAAVKAKSKWIGPNMSLIYQLTDWKKKVSDAPRTAFGAWRNGPGVVSVRGLVKGAPTGGLGRGAGGSDDQTGDDMQEPQTAPLPDRRSSPSVSPLLAPVRPASRDQPKPQMVRTRSENGGFISGVSPGPSSAPPGMVTIPKASAPDNRLSWPDGDAIFRPANRHPSPPPAPTHSTTYPPRHQAYAPPPPLRPADAYTLEREKTQTIDREKAQMPGQFESKPFDSEELGDLPPPTPAITSPRNSGYFGFSMRRPAPWGGFFQDPRSPNERGNETPVLRNIFDVL